MPVRLDFDLPVGYRQVGGRSFPLVSVTFLSVAPPGQEFHTWALVDSGAEVSYFDAAICPAIGIPDVRTGVYDPAGGVGGRADAWRHTVRMRVFNLELTAPVSFGDPFNFPFPLLGRLEVFNRFKICFRESRSVIHVATTP